MGVVVMTLAASCAAPAPVPTATAAPPKAPAGLDSDHVLLAIDDVSGWPGFEGVYDPRIATLTADGTLVTHMPNRGGHLPIATTKLDQAGLDAAWGAVQSSGTARDASFDLPGLFDASTTAIRVDDGTRATELSIYGLGSEAGDEPFSPEEAGLRRAATSLITQLQLLAGPEPWRPPAILLWSVDPDEEGTAPQAVPWSPPVDLATAGVAVDNPVYQRCVRLEGDVAGEVADFLRGLPGDALVEQAGTRYGVAVRPIYPDELGEFEAIGWKHGGWHGVAWYALELGPRVPEPRPLVPLPALAASEALAAALESAFRQGQSTSPSSSG